MPPPLFGVSPGWRLEGQGGRVGTRRWVTGQFPRPGTDHGREALVAPQAVQQAPPACRHKRGGALARPLRLCALEHPGEPQPPQPLHQAEVGLGVPGLGGRDVGRSSLGRAGQVGVWGAAQVQPVDVLEEELGGPRGEEVVGLLLAGLWGHRGGVPRVRGGIGGRAGEQAEEGLPGRRLWGRRRAVGGDLCGDAPLQDQLGQAAGGHQGASGGKAVAQAQPAGGHRGAGTGPHGARGVGHEGRPGAEKRRGGYEVRREASCVK